MIVGSNICTCGHYCISRNKVILPQSLQSWIHSSRIWSVITRVLVFRKSPKKRQSDTLINYMICTKFHWYLTSLKILTWIHSSKNLWNSITRDVVVQKLPNKLQSWLQMIFLTCKKFGHDWWTLKILDLNPFKQKS